MEDCNSFLYFKMKNFSPNSIEISYDFDITGSSGVICRSALALKTAFWVV